MNNIEQFNHVVVWSFAKLYVEFPNPIILKHGDFSQETHVENVNAETFGSSIEFMQREGFINIGSSVDDGSHFFFVVLTMKGLEILDSVPSSMKDGENLGQQTQSLVKSGFKEAGKGVIKALVSEIIKSATQ